jgi:hypothetical protein
MKGRELIRVIRVRRTKYLQQQSLDTLVDFSHVDGASNVCDYPTRGHTNSYTAFQKSRWSWLVTWWCIAHRFNLALGDLLRGKSCAKFIKFIRLLVSFTRKSSWAGNIDIESQLVKDDIATLNESLSDLEKKIADIGDEDDEKRNDLAFQQEIHVLEEELKTTKLSKEDFEHKLKILGRKRKLKSYLIVRWFSLFDTVDSNVAQLPFISKFLQKQAAPFSRKVERREVDLAVSRDAVDAKNGSEHTLVHAHHTFLFFSFHVVPTIKRSFSNSD